MKVDEVVEWEQKLRIRRTIVLFMTVWMTWRSFRWATEYAAATITMDEQGMKAAATILAVTAPITYLQKVVFESYNSK